MIPSVCLQLSIMIVASISFADETRDISEAKQVFAIYTEDCGLGTSDGPKLIFSAWEDGTMVWSDDRVNGGAPYKLAKIDPKVFLETLDRLKSMGIFDLPKLKEGNFGPDSQFTTILIRDGEQILKAQSWHELYEQNGKVIATDRGITSLDGKTLLEGLTKESSSYLAFRLAWSEVRLAAANLIPANGVATSGDFDMRAGVTRWVIPKDE